MTRYLAPILAGLLLWPAAASASTPINESHPAQSDVHVRISNIAGKVQVQVGDDDRVTVTGTLGAGSKPLRIEGERSRLSIQVEPEDNGSRRGRNMGSSELVVRVPRAARVEVKTVSANVEVDGIAGSQAEIETVSGDVRYRADADRVHLKSVSGDIDGEGAGRVWNVATVSGRVRLPRSAGELRLESVSGSIELNFSQAEQIRAETVSGRIRAEGELAASGVLAMQSVSGSIELRLSGTIDASIRGKTFSGAIDSEFGTPERSGIGGGHRLDTHVGTGGGEIRLESFSGRLSIRRAEAASGR